MRPCPVQKRTALEGGTDRFVPRVLQKVFKQLITMAYKYEYPHLVRTACVPVEETKKNLVILWCDQAGGAGKNFPSTQLYQVQ